VVENTYELGTAQWGDVEEKGEGQGQITLSMLYRSVDSFSMLELEASHERKRAGLLLVSVQYATGLPPAEGGRHSQLYVRLRCDKQSFNSKTVVCDNGHPVWDMMIPHEFHDVSHSAMLKIKVLEKTVAADEPLGWAEISMAELGEHADVDPLLGKPCQGFLANPLPLEEADGGSIKMELRYVPYF
jgi:hypothetical protein